MKKNMNVRNQYFRVSRGMVFWFDPSKAYGESSEYLSNLGKTCVSHLQKKERPWVVVSNNRGNSSSAICTIAPITSENKPYRPHHVEFRYEGKRQIVLLEQLRTVDSYALGGYMYTVSDSVLRDIERAIAYQFDIRPSIATTDFALDTTLKNLEQVISSIIQEKVKEYTVSVQPNVIPTSQIQDTALRLGHMVEELCTKEVKPVVESKTSNPVATKTTSKPAKPKKSVNPPAAPEQPVQEIKPHKQPERLSQVDKFNQRLQKAQQITGKPVQNHSVPEQPVKRKRNKWTPDKCREYLNDCEKFAPEEVMKKWNLSSIQSVFSTKYTCKNILNK